MCIFCDIVNGSIPAYKIYEDEQVLAFLDISQTTKGHTLVIPKKHYTNILEIDDETLTHLMKIAKQVGNQLMESLDAQGMNVLSNINEISGQTVMHAHVHLIPRYDDSDCIEINFNENKDSNIEKTFKKIKGV